MRLSAKDMVDVSAYSKIPRTIELHRFAANDPYKFTTSAIMMVPGGLFRHKPGSTAA